MTKKSTKQPPLTDAERWVQIDWCVEKLKQLRAGTDDDPPGGMLITEEPGAENGIT